MKLKDLMIEATSICREKDLEIEAVKKLLIELKYQSAANFILGYNDEVEDEVVMKVNKYLLDNIPIQYILGYCYFYGLKLYVNGDTLIPRADTEVLVGEAIKEINMNKYLTCLDLCTGSGAIALAVKNNTNCEMSASDISENALFVAKTNASNLDINIRFFQSDILENIDYQFDIILSNPPYIGYNDYVQKIVKDNEPHLALFADDEGLYFYKKILRQIKIKQQKIKMIIFEIGYNQAFAVIGIIHEIFQNVQCEVIKDLAGMDRVIKVYFC